MNKLQLLVISAALCAGPAAADDVTLRDGSRIEGTLVGASEQVLHLRTADGVRHVPIAEIAAIGFSPRSAEPVRATPATGRDRALIVGSGPELSIKRQ